MKELEEVNTKLKADRDTHGVDANGASGPIRGRITPIFGIFQYLTGIDMAKAVNDTFGNSIFTIMFFIKY